MLVTNRTMAKAMATNANTSAFTAKTALVKTRPSGNLVTELAPTSGGKVPARVRIFPYGLGSNNDAFSMRVWGWTQLGPTSAPLWLPAALGEFACTISAFSGVAGGNVLNTELFADTITVVATVGEPTITADVTRAGTAVVFSPANDTPAWVEISLRGIELLEFDWDQTTNTPTMNALLQFLDEVNGP